MFNPGVKVIKINEFLVKSYGNMQHMSREGLDCAYCICLGRGTGVPPPPATPLDSDILTVFNSVYPTYSSSDQQQLEAAEQPHAGRSEVS